VDYSYVDGQFWDETIYSTPIGTVKAEVRLYYQSTSKEFVEFLRDENHTNRKGQELYDLWNNNGKCPPTLMANATWYPVFSMPSADFDSVQKALRIRFKARPGASYTIQYSDGLSGNWSNFQKNGTLTATNSDNSFSDDFSSNTSGGAPASGTRFYRFLISAP
jgi:hypothetical protein